MKGFQVTINENPLQECECWVCWAFRRHKCTLFLSPLLLLLVSRRPSTVLSLHWRHHYSIRIPSSIWSVHLYLNVVDDLRLWLLGCTRHRATQGTYYLSVSHFFESGFLITVEWFNFWQRKKIFRRIRWLASKFYNKFTMFCDSLSHRLKTVASISS